MMNTTEDGDEERPPLPDEEEAGDHDQLPTVEEYKTQVAVDQNGSEGNCLWGAVYAVMTVLIGILLIVIGVVIGKDTSSPPTAASEEAATSRTSAPEPYTENRWDAVVETLVSQKWANRANLDMNLSPQRRAATWIANEDVLALDVTQPTDDLKERYALSVLYFAWEGNDWPHTTYWLTGRSNCDWFEIYKDQDYIPSEVGGSCHDTKHVKSIALPGFAIAATIPTEIGLLNKLTRLKLPNNKLKATANGGLPTAFSELTDLDYLNLENNELFGNIPNMLGDLTNLKYLNLKNNAFDGSIPSSFSKLSQMHTMNLEKNFISGHINQFKGLGSLQAILLGDNKLTGQFTEDVFSTWKNIQALDLSDNELAGQLPKELFALSSLAILDLHGNNLMGDLPNLVSINSDIHFLALHENQFTGGLESLQLMEQLEHLDLSKNNFTQAMPAALGGLKQLRYLFLAYNNFALGEIPTEYGQLTKLVDLSLQETNRVHSIPTEFGKLTKLRLMDLNSNSLTGKLPTQLGQLEALNFFMAKNNNLQGSIPTEFSSWQKVDAILLNNNFIKGSAAPICGPPKALPVLNEFIVSNCDDMTNCTCCQCCEKDDPSCDWTVWFSGLDPVYSEAYNYEREFYQFHEKYVKYPTDPDAVGERQKAIDALPSTGGSSGSDTGGNTGGTDDTGNTGSNGGSDSGSGNSDGGGSDSGGSNSGGSGLDPTDEFPDDGGSGTGDLPPY